MKRNDNPYGLGAIGIGSAAPSLSALTALLGQRAKLSEEERAKRQEAFRLKQEERARQAKIIKNVCPGCEGKLIRGKKDKKNDYKRAWVCQSCTSTHSI